MVTTNKSPKNKLKEHPLNDVAGLWALRILLQLNGINALAPYCLTNDGEILKTFGMGELEGSDISKDDFIKILRERQAEYEAKQPSIRGILKNNLNHFGKLIGLSKPEMKILGFAVAIHSHRGLENTGDTLGNLNGADVMYHLSTILNISLKKIRIALDRKGALASSGLLKLSKNGNAYLRTKLDLMRDLDNTLQELHMDMLGMVRDYFFDAGRPSLLPEDYSYISKDYNLISQYLARAQKNGLTGVNILIHGRPGTGKSELAKTLAGEIGFNLYEISISDRDGDPLTGNNRFGAYQLCQKILAKQKHALVLFDEVEDVFPDDSMTSFIPKNNSDRRKAWLNHLLEENPVPSIWISNNIKQVDNAFIRRFDFVLKLDHPPKDVRTRILHKHFSNLAVSSQWIENVAENPDIAPALVSRAARVVSVIEQGENGHTNTENSLEHLMGNTLEAMGYSGKLLKKREEGISYCLDALNSDVDIHQLVEGLKHRPEGRLCLYGPPGTGKTEFGHYVARTLEKPLMVKRASDILGPYVGMTEQHIASMYEQAKQDDAILLLDEADSFLRDRTLAQQSWEVTQVNEMLTQMENYDGIFICSTNLIDNLDSASLRRFDFKIYFDYLKPDQSWALFQKTLKAQGASTSKNKILKEKLSRHTNLTPGDFATIVRQKRLSKLPLSAETLLSGLSRESTFKQVKKSSGIGFTADI